MGKIIRGKIWVNQKKNLGLFRRVYLATKKNDEKKCKYAVKVISKTDIRRKNLIDQSTDEWTPVSIAKHRFSSSSQWTRCFSLDG